MKYPERFIRQFLKNVDFSSVTDTGAKLSYYLLFSIFPFLIVILNIFGMVSAGNMYEIVKLIRHLPISAAKIVEDIFLSLVDSSSGSLLSASLVLALWSGSRGMLQLLSEVRHALKRKREGGIVREKVTSMIYTILLVLIVVLIASTNVFGKLIKRYIILNFGKSVTFDILWTLLMDIIPYGLTILTFTFLYRFAGGKCDKIKIQDALVGGIFTTVLWVIITLGFSFYVENFGSYDKTYGSLGGVIALMLWLFLSSIVMVLGAYVVKTKVDLKPRKTINKYIREEG